MVPPQEHAAPAGGGPARCRTGAGDGPLVGGVREGVGDQVGQRAEVAGPEGAAPRVDGRAGVAPGATEGGEGAAGRLRGVGEEQPGGDCDAADDGGQAEDGDGGGQGQVSDERAEAPRQGEVAGGNDSAAQIRGSHWIF